MKIKAIYRKNLKMSEGKVAAQVAHAVRFVERSIKNAPTDCVIIVLKVSDKKFDELVKQNDAWTQSDWGLTEVEKDTATAAAWIETKSS